MNERMRPPPRERLNRSGLWRAARLTILAAACCLTLGACSSSSSSSYTPPPGGIYESFLANEPTAELDLTHTAVLFLEPSGGHVGDTGTEHGFDEIPYRFEAGTQLTLAVEAPLDAAPTLTLFDERGVEVARVGPALPSQSVTVSGSYRLHVEHAQSGRDDAPEQLLFLQPVSMSQVLAAGPQVLAKDLDGLVDPAEVLLKAGVNCVTCDLRGINLHDLNFLTGTLDLSGSDFTGATLKNVNFVGAKLNRAIFDSAQFFHVAFWEAKLTGASFQYAQFLQDPSCAATDCSADPGYLSFTSCCMTHSCFKGRSAKTDLTETCNACALDHVIFKNLPKTNDGTMDQVNFTNAVFNSVCIEADDLNGTKLSIGGRFGPLHRTEIPKLLSSNLAGADLSSVDFTGVDLSKVDLSDALLSGGELFADATLSDGVAHGVNLTCKRELGPPYYYTGGCYFNPGSTQFKGKNLAWAKLNDADLTLVDMQGAVLDHAQLVGANLNLANLRGASLVAATLGVDPIAPIRSAASMIGAYMRDVDLTDADLRSVNLSNAQLSGTNSKLVRTKLDSASLTNTTCVDCEFTSSFLTSANFNDAVLVNANFSGARLANTSFVGAHLEGTDFSNASSVVGASLVNAFVATSGAQWSYKEQDGSPYTVSYNPTNLGAFATDTSVRCPDATNGGCDPDSLTPQTPRYPLIPPCTMKREYCYMNCGYPALGIPPDFTHHPPSCH